MPERRGKSGPCHRSCRLADVNLCIGIHVVLIHVLIDTLPLKPEDSLACSHGLIVMSFVGQYRESRHDIFFEVFVLVIAPDEHKVGSKSSSACLTRLMPVRMAAAVGVGHIFIQTTQEGNAIHPVRVFLPLQISHRLILKFLAYVPMER